MRVCSSALLTFLRAIVLSKPQGIARGRAISLDSGLFTGKSRFKDIIFVLIGKVLFDSWTENACKMWLGGGIYAVLANLYLAIHLAFE